MEQNNNNSIFNNWRNNKIAFDSVCERSKKWHFFRKNWNKTHDTKTAPLQWVNLKRLTSNELLSSDGRECTLDFIYGHKRTTPEVFESLTFTLPVDVLTTQPQRLCLIFVNDRFCQRILFRNETNLDHSRMKNLSKKITEEKRPTELQYTFQTLFAINNVIVSSIFWSKFLSVEWQK